MSNSRCAAQSAATTNQLLSTKNLIVLPQDSLQKGILPVNDTLKRTPNLARLPLDFYSTHLGPACKMELKLEKQTKLPLRIRLGSKDQVDYLEGKYNRH